MISRRHQRWKEAVTDLTNCQLIQALSREPRVIASFDNLKETVSDEVRQEFGESQVPRLKRDSC